MQYDFIHHTLINHDNYLLSRAIDGGEGAVAFGKYGGQKMNVYPELKIGRGIQEAEVWAAADRLLSEGLRPTIERVRQRLGRGSPNTVSPMIERWFASLSQRMVGGAAAAGNDSDGVPVSVRNATRLLWETARREAEQVQEAALEKVRDELKAKEAELEAQQLELTQREAAFAAARPSLDHALASSQQAREALEQQVTALASEGLRQREAAAKEVARLGTLLVEAQANTERLRQDHAGALTIRDQDLRDAVDRHTAHERRMLLEVDRARQVAKVLEVSLAREQQQRRQSEEAAAQTLEAGRQTLRETQQAAQQTERALRDQGALQATQLIQSQSQRLALQQRLDDLALQISEEKKAHEGTRELLAGSLADQRKTVSAKRASAKQPKQSQ